MSVSSFRRICCYHSTSFYKTFNGNFKEGTEQRITLETRTANFQMVIQWMHTGAISLPTSTAAKSKKTQNVSRASCSCRSNCLLGPFDRVTASTKAILVSDHQHFLTEHVRTAFASSESSNPQALRSVAAWPMPVLLPSWRGLYSQFIELCSKRIPF